MEAYVGTRIRKITFNLREIYQATAKQDVPESDITATGKTYEWVKKTLGEILDESSALGLGLTSRSIDRDLHEIKADTKCKAIRARMEELERRICDELELVRFVHVRNENLKYLDGIVSFG